ELTWTEDAVARMERVPAGFMRMLAQTKVEEFARKIQADTITRDVVEGGLVDARLMMDQALKAHSPDVVDAAMRAHGHSNGNGKKPQEPSPGWTEDGVRRLNEVEIRAEEKFEPARAREMAQHAAESRAARTSEAINAAFLERLGIKIGYGHPLSPKTFEHRFSWSPEAEARLEKLPSYCRELSRWRVEWTAAKSGLGPVITPEVMDVKFEMWDEVSQALQRKERQLPWDPEAEGRLTNMPDFVKGQVMEAVEGNARELGEPRVTNKVMDAVIQKWIETGDFHEGRYGFRA
ncbi:MAG TPA: PCP reductase family protein, partial [Candidatus Dormibacteraeota bacterium]